MSGFEVTRTLQSIMSDCPRLLKIPMRKGSLPHPARPLFRTCSGPADVKGPILLRGARTSLCIPAFSVNAYWRVASALVHHAVAVPCDWRRLDFIQNPLPFAPVHDQAASKRAHWPKWGAISINRAVICPFNGLPQSFDQVCSFGLPVETKQDAGKGHHRRTDHHDMPFLHRDRPALPGGLDSSIAILQRQTKWPMNDDIRAKGLQAGPHQP